MSHHIPEAPSKGHDHEIDFNVDGEPYKTTERELTPNEILRQFAEKDTVSYYLVQIEGNHRISYQDKGEERIKMHEGMRFQTISTGPTPVSSSW